MEIRFRLGTIDDLNALERVGDRLFDDPIKRTQAIAFLNDARHHLALAFDGIEIVGMASGFHYLHPDKEPQLFVNEVGVLEAYQNKGIGRKLVRLLCGHGKALGCSEAWVLTERSNSAAKKMYLGAGGSEEQAPIVLIAFEK